MVRRDGVLTVLLGVTIAKNLSWDKHIESLAVKAGQCLDILNVLKYKLDHKTLQTVYFVFVRSKHEYANIVLTLF